MRAPVTQLIDEYVVHDCKQPRAQIASGAPQMALVDSPLESVLHEIVRTVLVTDQRARIPPQPWNVLGDSVGVHIGAARGSRNQGRATRHMFSAPSPDSSPGLTSRVEPYNGFPWYAHCLLPSSRLRIV